MKSIYYVISVLTLFLSIQGAQAQSIVLETTKAQSILPNFVKKCVKVAVEKLRVRADAYGIEIDLETIQIRDVNRGIYSYIWWSADVTNLNSRTDLNMDPEAPLLTVLTQTPPFGDCF